MEKYTVDFNNGLQQEVEGSLNEILEVAQNEMTYTGESVTIKDQEGNAIFKSRWYGVKATENDEVLADFGDFGFYEKWTDEF